MLTLVLDDGTFAAAGGTDALCLHHAEDALGGVGDDAAAVTGRTLLVGAACLGAAAVAMRTSDVLAHLELLGDAMGYLLQRQLDLQTEVAAAMNLRTALATTESLEASPAAKDVTEHGEDVVHVHGCGVETAKSAHARPIETELVVLLTLLRVMQHIIGFSSLLEFFLGFLVAGITVRVVFNGDGAVRLLYLVFGGVLVNAKHLVIITLLGHDLIFNV